ncbi:PF04339 family protein [Leptospira fainei serovar Hurstbridge str. BUT 6]|uniref:PF04339 family protein n=1 Tax=Leptospira fainei serovar Hurstbridge str. BUT 6 TaxID=1193011 RepID=S3UYG9_9LEPT|nr:GNAT family N-acetyltransferase [Leptospira fainei]EPG75461.1 PF04339 family protein [Leptospira fainei serovar Hurstbridge str. BUT 6]
MSYFPKARSIDSVQDLSIQDWNRISDPNNPFSDYEFYAALESTSCVGDRTSWQPKYIIAEDSGGLHSAFPFFLKYDSYGEYIFDHAWANFFAQNDLEYYPKGLIAYPFTPVTGRRILRREGVSVAEALDVLLPELMRASKEENLSSLHFLFLEEDEAIELSKRGFATRITHQYHWQNRDYSDFDSFLSEFRSKKRMQIRKERENVRESGIQIRIVEGDSISKSQMDSMFRFYTDTYSRKWGSPYLNLAFFREAWQTFRDKIVLILAEKGGETIGGTLNLRKGNKFYGRYWGSNGHYPFLHFECCYYAPIEYSIRKGIRTFEAGAQGEQKFLRGFPAVPTYSSHFIFHSGARNAIERFLENERMHMQEMILETNEHSPLREVPGASDKEAK